MAIRTRGMKTSTSCSVAFGPEMGRRQRSWCGGTSRRSAELRVRLVDTRLNRLLDSMDICQSVLASFFVRAALGQYELETPEQLLKLLATMTRNKLLTR